MYVPLLKEQRRPCPKHLHVGEKEFFVLNP
jgi:hypothetical protein